MPSNFPAEDLQRLGRTLTRLVPHFAPGDLALAGGAAVEHHLEAAGRAGLRTSLDDVDVVARRVEGNSGRLGLDYVISHYHRAGPGVPKGLLQIVDPGTRLRVDVFPDLDGALGDAADATVAGASVLVLSAQRILDHKLRTLGKSSRNDPADPKHWHDARALADLLGREAPVPPPHVRPSVMSRDLDARCERCEHSASPAFPLASKRVVFALLGYV